MIRRNLLAALGGLALTCGCSLAGERKAADDAAAEAAFEAALDAEEEVAAQRRSLEGVRDELDSAAQHGEAWAHLSDAGAESPLFEEPDLFLPEPVIAGETYAEYDARRDALDGSRGSFMGYGCTVDCSGHQAGYQWAEENRITDPDKCGGKSWSFIEGCRAYAENGGNFTMFAGLEDETTLSGE